MSSKEEELYETSYEDEDVEMAMLARRYMKLAFQRDQRMGIGRRNFLKDRFRNEPSRNNQITCYGCKQPKHMRLECPINKEGKKDKKKKKDMVATWSDSDPSSSDGEQKMKIKANLFLIAKDDEVCLNELDDFDTLQNEYECLFNDFKKLRHKCKDYKKIITTLTLDVENAKHEYDVAIDNKIELEKCFDDLKSKNKALRLELENKCKALNECMNEKDRKSVV